MKKLFTVALSALLAVSAVAGLASCSGGNESKNVDYELKPVAKADIKVGFIFLHDENSTYDKNFIDAAKRAQEKFGLADAQVKMVDNVPEGQECYDKAAELVDEGCDVIFADSFGHEEYIRKAAIDFPGVRFCHATGTKAHTYSLANYSNAFASIYEGRYLAGVAAGMKLNTMTKPATGYKMGYVGAFPYAEVISGYTSFYLGAKSVCSDVTMEVTFTNSWYDVNAEAASANLLISNGCQLISQHADSMGAPSACEEKKVPNVSYNGSTQSACPDTYIISSYIDWTPYFEYMIQCTLDGVRIAPDWCGDISTGSVCLTELNTSVAAEGTQAKLDEVKAMLKAGTLHVFDTSTFTVGGKTLTSYLADVHDRGDYVAETEAIANGYFHESEYRSAPYFDVAIDGITRLDKQS